MSNPPRLRFISAIPSLYFACTPNVRAGTYSEPKSFSLTAAKRALRVCSHTSFLSMSAPAYFKTSVCSEPVPKRLAL